jgi:hypothetical protein
MSKVNISGFKQFVAINIKFIIVIILIIATFLYFFIPRKLSNTIHIENISSSDIKEIQMIIMPNNMGSELHKYIVNDKSLIDEILSTFSKNYVRKKVFRTTMTNGTDFQGYYFSIVLKKQNKIISSMPIYYFTKKVIEINENQYVIYGDTFSKEFNSILEKIKN